MSNQSPKRNRRKRIQSGLKSRLIIASSSLHNVGLVRLATITSFQNSETSKVNLKSWQQT